MLRRFARAVRRRRRWFRNKDRVKRRPCGNTRADSPHNRYNIDPRELIRIQREGRERGEDIVGFYHSHPDHPRDGRPPIWRKRTGLAVRM